MQPTHENIDRWLFDYTEGNLSPDQEQQLETFLMNHPDLELDMDAWEMSKVDAEPFVFDGKDQLYKKRNYRPVFALLGLFVFILTGYALFGPSTDKHETSSAPAQGKTRHSIHTLNLKSNVQPSSPATIEQSITSPQTYTTHQRIPVSSPYLNEEQLSTNSTFDGTHALATEISSTNTNGLTPPSDVQANELTIVSSTNNRLPSADQAKDSYELLLTRPLKNMLIGGYRTDFKKEELHQSKDLDIADVCLGNIDLFKKIDHLLSQDIGLSNNQSYDYTLPGQSNLDVNFSSVGTTSQTRFQAISSIRSFENPQQIRLNNQLSFDTYARNLRSGFGMQANYDDFGNGLIKNGNVAMIFSPKIALTRKISLEPAVRFKMGTSSLNEQKMSNLSFVEYTNGQVNQFQFNPNLAIGHTLWYRDLDAGLTIHTPMFFLSGQLTNLFRHNENIYSNNGETLAAARNLHVILGTQYISRNEKLIFAPYALYQHASYQQQLFGGFTFKAGKAQLGFSYGNLHTAGISLGYVGRNFALIGQSGYGTLLSTQARTYTHQLTLRIHSSVSKKARRYISL
ncbi:MAG: hypothetical protein ACKOXP_09535 [Flavobacteriales bacterium]